MASQPAPPAVSDSVLFDLTVAVQPTRRAWLQAAGCALAVNGLPIPLATAILLVFRHGSPAPQSMVALEAGVNPAALVRTLDQGEQDGLLKRRDAKEDRRSKLIELTPKGRALAQHIENNLAQLRRQVIGDLPAQDVQTATRVLRHLESRAAAYAKHHK